jgi:hypothetical protein
LLSLFFLVALILPPFAASAGIGPEDRRAVLVIGPGADRVAGINAALASNGRPLSERLDGHLVLAVFDGPIPVDALMEAGVLLVLDAALLEGCGAL